MNKFEDQTQFAQEEPTLEDVHVPVAPVLNNDPQMLKKPEEMTPDELLEFTKVQKAKKGKKILVLAGIVFAIFLLGFVLVIALMPQQSPPPIIDNNLETQKPTNVQTKIELDVQELKDRLEQIDPTLEYLTIPPVDYAISLD